MQRDEEIDRNNEIREANRQQNGRVTEKNPHLTAALLHRKLLFIVDRNKKKKKKKKKKEIVK